MGRATSNQQANVSGILGIRLLLRPFLRIARHSMAQHERSSDASAFICWGLIWTKRQLWGGISRAQAWCHCCRRGHCLSNRPHQRAKCHDSCFAGAPKWPRISKKAGLKAQSLLTDDFMVAVRSAAPAAALPLAPLLRALLPRLLLHFVADISETLTFNQLESFNQLEPTFQPTLPCRYLGA